MSISPVDFACDASYGEYSKGSQFGWDFHADKLIDKTILATSVDVTFSGWFYPYNDDGDLEPYYAEAVLHAYNDGRSIRILIDDTSFGLQFFYDRSPTLPLGVVFYTR